jgi:hypothetical protein
LLGSLRFGSDSALLNQLKIASSLNSQQDAAIPVPIGMLDVTQARSIPIPTGVTSFVVVLSGLYYCSDLDAWRVR